MIEVLFALALVVVGVSDGDTLTVQDGDVKTVLRLAGDRRARAHAALLAGLAAQPGSVMQARDGC